MPEAHPPSAPSHTSRVLPDPPHTTNTTACAAEARPGATAGLRRVRAWHSRISTAPRRWHQGPRHRGMVEQLPGRRCLSAAAPAWRPGRSSAHTAGHAASQHGSRADDGCPRRCPSCVKTCVVRRAQCLMWARGVVVSHPLSMREALGSIPSVSMLPAMQRFPLLSGVWLSAKPHSWPDFASL